MCLMLWATTLVKCWVFLETICWKPLLSKSSASAKGNLRNWLCKIENSKMFDYAEAELPLPSASHPELMAAPCKIKAEIIIWNATRHGDIPTVCPFQHAIGHARLVLPPLPALLAEMAWYWTMMGTVWHLDTALTLSTTLRKLRPASLVIRNVSTAQDPLNTSVLAVWITAIFSVSVLLLPLDFILHWEHEIGKFLPHLWNI